jgi:hypothetical protein
MAASIRDGFNPFRDDPEMKGLLEKLLTTVETQSEFTRWKSSFLNKFDTFLDAKGSKAAEEAYNGFSDDVYTFGKMLHQLEGHIYRAELTRDNATVKARKCLEELKKIITASTDGLAALLPGSGITDDKTRESGYTNYHMGAVLVGDGFSIYGYLNTCDKILKEFVQRVLLYVADKQLLWEIGNYSKKLQVFCDVMADLGLHEVMVKSREILEKEEKEDGEIEAETEAETDSDTDSDSDLEDEFAEEEPEDPVPVPAAAPPKKKSHTPVAKPTGKMQFPKLGRRMGRTSKAGNLRNPMRSSMPPQKFDPLCSRSAHVPRTPVESLSNRGSMPPAVSAQPLKTKEPMNSSSALKSKSSHTPRRNLSGASGGTPILKNPRSRIRRATLGVTTAAAQKIKMDVEKDFDMSDSEEENEEKPPGEPVHTASSHGRAQARNMGNSKPSEPIKASKPAPQAPKLPAMGKRMGRRMSMPASTALPPPEPKNPPKDGLSNSEHKPKAPTEMGSGNTPTSEAPRDPKSPFSSKSDHTPRSIPSGASGGTPILKNPRSRIRRATLGVPMAAAQKIKMDVEKDFDMSDSEEENEEKPPGEPVHTASSHGHMQARNMGNSKPSEPIKASKPAPQAPKLPAMGKRMGRRMSMPASMALPPPEPKNPPKDGLSNSEHKPKAPTEMGSGNTPTSEGPKGP